MQIRRPTIDDIPEIEDIAKKYSNNPLPDKFISAAVIENNQDIKAFGVLRNHIEALLYCDGTDREKVESLRLLMHRAVMDAQACKTVSELYVYAQDEKFAQILIKHYGFRKADGIPLILDL
jgi:hypothetical protein